MASNATINATTLPIVINVISSLVNPFADSLKYLYSNIYKEDAKFFIESPNKETIDKFGGHYSSEEYKKQIKQDITNSFVVFCCA